MSANVESMFYVRTTPWHGLGICVEEALNSKEALAAAGLDWNVIQKVICTEDGIPVEGFRANIRESDGRILGVVTSRYQVVQNEEAFAFTDSLLGEGVTYETAGSLQNGRKTWILAKLPQMFFASTFSSKMQIDFLKVAWGISPVLHFLLRHSFGCRRGVVAGIQSLLVTDM